MDTRDPSWWSVLGAMAIATLGGLVRYLQRLRDGKHEMSVRELAVDMTVAAFAGLVTMLFFHGVGLNEYVAGALAGVAGHWGSRSLALYRGYLTKKSS